MRGFGVDAPLHQLLSSEVGERVAVVVVGV